MRRRGFLRTLGAALVVPRALLEACTTLAAPPPVEVSTIFRNEMRAWSSLMLRDLGAGIRWTELIGGSEGPSGQRGDLLQFTRAKRLAP